MWINKKSLEDFRNRLAELERKHQSLVSDVTQGRNIDVYTGKKEFVSTPYVSYERYQSKQISLKEAMQKVLDHLGLKWSYIDGEPEKIELDKVKRS